MQFKKLETPRCFPASKGYHPLVLSLANTGEVLYLVNRSVTEDVCPILTGCHRARLHIGWGHAVGLACSSGTVIPLWSSGAQAAWSLVRYGEGWIVNVHSVDLTAYDGARFWLNFRLFCMGQPIPDAKTQRIVWETIPAPKAPSLMPIATVPELEKALAEIEKQRVSPSRFDAFMRTTLRAGMGRLI